MKVKVLKKFHDIYSDELYEIGQIIEVTNARGEELLANKCQLVQKQENDEVTEVENDGDYRRHKSNRKYKN